MRPDFTRVKKLINGLQNLDGLLRGMFSQTDQLRDTAARLCAVQMKKQAAAGLQQIPVLELKNSKAGIRTTVLEEGGYRSLFDLYEAQDSDLRSLSGVGERQISSIRMILDEFLSQMAGRERIRLTSDRQDEENVQRICALARYRLSDQVCRDAKDLSGQMHAFLEDMIPRVRIRNRARWFFSLKETKAETLDAVSSLEAFEGSADHARAERFAKLYLEAVSITEEQAFADFEKNSAAYYALLEKLTGAVTSGKVLYGSIPEQLAAEVDAEELDLSGFRGDLRSYQQFGAKYILHQKKVLLGDEMGLGKTIQAIAAMAHLHAADPQSHFLIVCPASVMVNWCREIEKFSDIPVQLLHGSLLRDGFAKWKSNGGAAVTNYESMRHLADQINDKMQITLMVIDEAHYIKNPEAQRTRNIHMLEDESERILLMTGTPLENRVHEMCELIGFVAPEMEPKIREHVGLRRTAQFKEMLSPVYLRRQVSQVLEELPERIEKEEWCSLSEADLVAYRQAVGEGNFMAMRRVSFLQEDFFSSSKSLRLIELCEQARESGLKVVVYSYFRETLRKAREIFKDDCAGEITGNTAPLERQAIIDAFSSSDDKNILLCQTQAGGTGLNIQTASVVIFCEPQIKPSLERQAVARVYRMGQIRNVRVYHLLCEHTVDEAVWSLLSRKDLEFRTYADESVMAEAEADLANKDWIREVVAQERQKYLPAVI